MDAKIWNRSFYIEETDSEKLKDFFEGALSDAGFSVIEFSDHHFEPQGYTAFWLLAESHFVVHTFPEQGRTYCELSSCNLEKFVSFIKEVKDVEV